METLIDQLGGHGNERAFGASDRPAGLGVGPTGPTGQPLALIFVQLSSCTFQSLLKGSTDWISE